MQAAEAEDAVVEAAAAQVRSAGLETRTQDLEAALAEAETRAAAATDAETRMAAALASQREVTNGRVHSIIIAIAPVFTAQAAQGRKSLYLLRWPVVR